MAFSKLTESERLIKSNMETLNDSHATIQNQIKDNDLKKGEIAFFDENGNRLRSKSEGNKVIFSDDHGNQFASKQNRGKDRLIIPTGTKRIVANCDADISGVNTTAIYVAGNLTGKNVSIPHSEIHATGNVDLTKTPGNPDVNYVTIVNGGDTKLNGFKCATVVSGGNKKIFHNGSKSSQILEDSAAMAEGSHTDRIFRSRNNTRESRRPSLAL